MSDSDGQERTESATPRRLEQAREKGQVPRSRELASVAVLVAGAVALMWFGEGLATSLAQVMTKMFSLSRDDIFDLNKLFDLGFDPIISRPPIQRIENAHPKTTKDIRCSKTRN